MVEKADYLFALVDISAVKEHEQIDENRLRALMDEITCDGVLKCPIIIDKESMVILDGHHRFNALLQMGCRIVPAYLVDYINSGIRVGAWQPGVNVNKESVIRAGITGKLYPRRHQGILAH